MIPDTRSGGRRFLGSWLAGTVQPDPALETKRKEAWHGAARQSLRLAGVSSAHYYKRHQKPKTPTTQAPGSQMSASGPPGRCQHQPCGSAALACRPSPVRSGAGRLLSHHLECQGQPTVSATRPPEHPQGCCESWSSSVTTAALSPPSCRECLHGKT